MDTKKLSPLYRPDIIIHGGAGVILREHLPPELYKQYEQSLTNHILASRALLDDGASALDAACHAVSLLEDDPLFNCGRGSVFTATGQIEMEASLMVTSIHSESKHAGSIKRTGAVSGVRNTRHPIQLAREVLRSADPDEGRGRVRDMHCHLSGTYVERWGWKRGLEQKDDDWFWTKRRWDEHRRGLKDKTAIDNHDEELPLPSQGTVGCVCFDQYGNMAVATSTGGLTNKAPGRVGDTPMAGAGFWAETWDESDERALSSRDEGMTYRAPPATSPPPYSRHFDSAPPHWSQSGIFDALSGLSACFPSILQSTSPQYTLVPNHYRTNQLPISEKQQPGSQNPFKPTPQRPHKPLRRAIAVSGTGNGDSFVRVNAARTAGAECRFRGTSLKDAVTHMAGPGGELQQSAGDRWDVTGEGQGGIIGIEFHHGHARSTADFNCPGMWRAYFERHKRGGEDLRVRVWRDEEYDDNEGEHGYARKPLREM